MDIINIKTLFVDLKTFMEERHKMSKALKQRLESQNRMKQFADSHRSKRQFEEGDLVLLKLQPYQ